MIKFCIDKFVDGKPYPNLARWQARPYTSEWRQFSTNWPFSEPVYFFEYLDQCGIPYTLLESKQSDRLTLYPISISYFDFGVNWFDIMPATVIEKLRSRSITLWFFYSEGDNPQRIKQNLYQQARQHHIDTDLILFTSANSAASSMPFFTHFVDDECLYQLRNQYPACGYHEAPRNHRFTILVRTHKWWRATTMARFWYSGLHKHSFFSYNTDICVGEHQDDNAIEVDRFEHLRHITCKFLDTCPFYADDLDSASHNLYATTVEKHFTDSYLNVVLETHMDVDQSGGVFLIEKTFKPIKHCQPFVIIGAAGSIQQLRNMGYRTFDHVIDHSYDQIEDTTDRWDRVCKEVERLSEGDLHQMYIDCKEDLLWNQKLFMTPKHDRLSTLLYNIQQSCQTS